MLFMCHAQMKIRLDNFFVILKVFKIIFNKLKVLLKKINLSSNNVISDVFKKT